MLLAFYSFASVGYLDPSSPVPSLRFKAFIKLVEIISNKISKIKFVAGERLGLSTSAL
jgi:hypothetical protein